MSELQSNTFEYLIHFNIRLRIERFPPGYRRKLVKERLALHSERAAHIVTVQYSDRIGYDVRFLHHPADFAKIVTRSVILPVANDQQSALLMSTTRDSVDAKVNRVVKSGVSFGLDQGQLSKYGFTVTGAIQ